MVIHMRDGASKVYSRPTLHLSVMQIYINMFVGSYLPMCDPVVYHLFSFSLLHITWEFFHSCDSSRLYGQRNVSDWSAKVSKPPHPYSNELTGTLTAPHVIGSQVLLNKCGHECCHLLSRARQKTHSVCAIIKSKACAMGGQSGHYI